MVKSTQKDSSFQLDMDLDMPMKRTPALPQSHMCQHCTLCRWSYQWTLERSRHYIGCTNSDQSLSNTQLDRPVGCCISFCRLDI